MIEKQEVKIETLLKEYSYLNDMHIGTGSNESNSEFSKKNKDSLSKQEMHP